jgi:excisionase family DNA binding protein
MPRVPRRHSPSSHSCGPTSFLSTAQLAELLGLSVRKLERDRQDGTGVPFIRFGRRVLYRRADVDAHVEAQRFISTAEARVAKEAQ